MKIFRKRFGVRAMIAYVGLFALLFATMRVSRDSRPAHLYAGWLSDGDVSRRIQAAQELGRTGSEPGVVSALVRSLLNDGVASVRHRSAVSLADVVSKLNDGPTTVAAASAFVQAMEDKDPAVRAAAAQGLGRIGPEPGVVVPALLRGAQDESEWVRGAAVGALGFVEGKAGIDRADVRGAIASAMSDSSLHVRELGIYAFWAVAEKSPGFSTALLKDGDVRTRRSAVIALARSSLVASAVVPELTAALTDEDAAVRDGAELALKNIGFPTRGSRTPGPVPR